MKDAALAMLAHVPPTQEVFLIGKHLAGVTDTVTCICQIPANPIADAPLDGQYDLFCLDTLQTAAIDILVDE